MIIEFFEGVGISHHFFDYLLKNGRFHSRFKFWSFVKLAEVVLWVICGWWAGADSVMAHMLNTKTQLRKILTQKNTRC